MRNSQQMSLILHGLAFFMLTSVAGAQTTTPPATNAAADQDNAANAALPAETLQTETNVGSRLTVPVMVNGKGPYRFMIDTGSTHTLVSKELAASLHLPVLGKRRLVSMGAAEEVNMVRVDRIGISPKRTLNKVEAPAVSAQNLGADGMLGIDALKGHRIVLDFVAETMEIEPSNSKAVREERDPSGTIVVNARNRLGQMVLVDADANGEELWVVLDTGGQNTVGNSQLRKLMGAKGKSGDFKQVELLGVLGDRSRADYMFVGRMRIGGVVVANAAVAFVDAKPFSSFGLSKKPALLLGIESLRGFRRVSIDFANRKVKFLLPSGASGAAATR